LRPANVAAVYACFGIIGCVSLELHFLGTLGSARIFDIDKPSCCACSINESSGRRDITWMF
jgi:hypothetical protein